MNKQFEAYYSKSWPYLWLALSIIFAALIVVFSILSLETISLLFIFISSICVPLFIYMFIKTKKQKGIATEIIDDVLILHKEETVSIPLKEITRIDINDGDGSFDIIVKTEEIIVSQHCFIQNQRQKKSALIDLLKNKKINVSTYDLL